MPYYVLTMKTIFSTTDCQGVQLAYFYNIVYFINFILHNQPHKISTKTDNMKNTKAGADHRDELQLRGPNN